MRLSFVLIASCFLFWSHSQNQLIEDLSYLAQDQLEGRSMGTKGEKLAAEYIAKRFHEIGLKFGGLGDSSYYDFFTKKTRFHPHDNDFKGPVLSGRNIIGILDRKASQNIIIGAHYDHLGWGDEGSLHEGPKAIHNGADDNASGVAALFYIAEKLKQFQLNANIIIIAFTGEEKGLLGSGNYIKNHGFELENTRFMINMDMIGRLNKEQKLAVNGVGTSPVFVPALRENNKSQFHLLMDSTGMGPSDHTSFYLDSIPVLHFFTGQHEQYHRPEDDVELINFTGLQKISDYIVALIIDLDKEQTIPFLKTKDPEQKRMKFKVTLGIIPDYLFEGKGLKIAGVKTGRTAEKAGLLKGDIVIQMGEREIKSIHDYMEVLMQLEKGDQVNLTILREGSKIDLICQF